MDGEKRVASPSRDGDAGAGPSKRARAEEEDRRLPYPICADLFLVTPDGVAGTKAEAA